VSREADRILVARLAGYARHCAQWRELSAAEEAAAVDALREMAAGRADLFAEVAGVLEGANEGELDEALARQAAGLCGKPAPTRKRSPHGWRKGAK
jgi:hypothetical protein